MNYNAEILNNITPPNGERLIIKNYQKTKDIIKDLIFCFKTYNHQVQPLIKNFKGLNSNSEAKKIYNFIKNNIEYKEEPREDQTTKSITAILHDKQGDCKHTALLAGSIAYQLGYNVIFKFVSYYPGENYGHVYVVINKPGEKEHFIIDTLQDFNSEKKYDKSLKAVAINNQLKNKTMLTRITGTGSEQTPTNTDPCRKIYLTPSLGAIALTNIDELGRITLRRNKPAANKPQPKKVTVKEKVKAITKKTKEKGGIVKVISLAPVRVAGLLLFSVNFRNFATRFKQLPAADQQSFAKKFGYNMGDLLSAVNKGAQKKPVFGNVAGVGAVALSASIAAAAPIILALVNTFRTKGLKEKGDTETVQTASDKIKEVLEKAENIEQSSAEIEQTAKDTNAPGIVDKVQTSIKENPKLWLAGAALAAFALNKKYKFIGK